MLYRVLEASLEGDMADPPQLIQTVRPIHLSIRNPVVSLHWIVPAVDRFGQVGRGVAGHDAND